MTALSPALRRLAALVLLLVVVPAAALLAIVPVTSRVQELREEIAAERELLGRFNQIASQQSRAAELDKAGEAAMKSEAYLKGESDAIKAAGLQRLLAELAAANRVRLHTTRALEARERGGVKLIGAVKEVKAGEAPSSCAAKGLRSPQLAGGVSAWLVAAFTQSPLRASPLSPLPAAPAHRGWGAPPHG